MALTTTSDIPWPFECTAFTLHAIWLMMCISISSLLKPSIHSCAMKRCSNTAKLVLQRIIRHKGAQLSKLKSPQAWTVAKDRKSFRKPTTQAFEVIRFIKIPNPQEDSFNIKTCKRSKLLKIPFNQIPKPWKSSRTPKDNTPILNNPLRSMSLPSHNRKPLSFPSKTL